ncbi:MAG: glutamine--tRNA ligase, partial [Clostridia bacterium]|nr:glutamine--tRNA ligase [Clostridia bacterium]
TVIHAECDMASRGGNAADGRKIKGTIHWVDSKTAVDAEVRVYENLFTDASPDAADKNFLDYLNPDSLKVLNGCKLEKSLKDAKAQDRFQFMRLGYFCVDSKDSTPDKLVFNRTVTLKDSWSKKGK